MSLGLAAVSMPQMLPMPMMLTMMTTLAFKRAQLAESVAQ